MVDQVMLTDLQQWQKEGLLYLKCLSDEVDFLEHNKTYFINDVSRIGNSIYFNITSDLTGLNYCIDFNDDNFELIIE